MSDSAEHNYLEIFPLWLKSLGEDAEALGGFLSLDALGQEPKEAITGGLNYLFKSLDLIPDGIDDIGYLDDAFVLRVGADLALRGEIGEIDGEQMTALEKLGADADVVRAFLGDDYPRLESYVMGLKNGAARGRTVGEILGDEEVRRSFLSDVRGFASTYEAPAFAREEKNLIKLKAFFNTKLPK